MVARLARGTASSIIIRETVFAVRRGIKTSLTTTANAIGTVDGQFQFDILRLAAIIDIEHTNVVVTICTELRMIVRNGDIGLAIAGCIIRPEVVRDGGMRSGRYEQGDIWIAFLDTLQDNLNGTVGALMEIELRLDTTRESMQGSTFSFIRLQCVGD